MKKPYIPYGPNRPYKGRVSQPNKLIDRIGQRYGSMVVTERAGNASSGDALWKCQCDCGRTVVKTGNNLTKVKTCGNHCTAIWGKEIPQTVEANGDPFGIIYKLTNLVDGKIYIGQTVFSLNKRWKRHIEYANRGGEGYLQKAIRKHGPENFKREVVAHARNKKQLDDLEKFYICSLDSLNEEIGYNLTWRPAQDEESRFIASKNQIGALNHYYRGDLETYNLAEMYKSGMTLSQIAAKVNTTHHTIGSRLRALGIEIKQQPNQKDLPMSEVCNKYLTGSSLEDLAKEYDISYTVIRDKILKQGIILRKPSTGKGNGLKREDIKTEDLVSAYLSGTKISDLSRIHKMDRKLSANV